MSLIAVPSSLDDRTRGRRDIFRRGVNRRDRTVHRAEQRQHATVDPPFKLPDELGTHVAKPRAESGAGLRRPIAPELIRRRVDVVCRTDHELIPVTIRMVVKRQNLAAPRGCFYAFHKENARHQSCTEGSDTAARALAA
jgi:hypothetical protein